MVAKGDSRAATRNRTAGHNWNRAAVLYLRQWWPTAERQLHAGRGDIGGIGDLVVECTIEPWAQIWKKLRQAENDTSADPAWVKHCGHCRAKHETGQECGVRDCRGCWLVPLRRDPFCVWKKPKRGAGEPADADPGQAAVIFRASVIFPLLARLAELEAAASRREAQRADDQEARWYERMEQ